jgi:hypothetical protein
VSADGSPTIQDLLAEWDQAMADQPEPAPLTQPLEPPRSRLSFAPPPPVFEPTFHDRIEPLLAPLRERVEAAELSFHERQLLLEAEHERRMAEVEEARKLRDDIVRAQMAINNVSNDPIPDYQLPSPATMADMSPQQWEKTVAEYRARHR